MIKKILIPLLLIFCSSCAKDKQLSENLPSEVLERMNDPNCSCNPYVDLYKWRQKYIYFFGFSGSGPSGLLCSWVARYVDQEGNELELNQQEMAQFNEEAEFEKTVWVCNEN